MKRTDSNELMIKTTYVIEQIKGKEIEVQIEKGCKSMNRKGQG